MFPGIVSPLPPFLSIQIQHVEGGFLCVNPPAPPVAAKLSNDVAVAMHLFLGQQEASEKSTATLSESLNLGAPIRFKWLPYRCPQGSVFSVSKIQRVDSSGGQDQGYMLTYHSATQDSARQVVAFNRATVMERLQSWTQYAPDSDGQASTLLTLSGMRPNPDMDTTAEQVFTMTVLHASRIPGYTGGTPYVANSDDPRLSLGLADLELITYVVDELSGDLEGEFAARIEDSWLEFGPRTDGSISEVSQ